MNGEVPSVPITTLAGISSLTDLLTELPLPSPLPSTVNNKGLLFSPRVAEEAKRLLGGQDENLIPQLLQALSQTNTDSIELKDKSSSNEIEGDVPALLQAILARNPNIFKRKVEQMGGVSPRQPMAPSPYYQQSPDTTGPQQSPGYPHGPASIQSNSSPAAFTPGSPAQQLLQNSSSMFPQNYTAPSLGGQGSPMAANVNGYTGHQFSPAAAAAGSPTTPPTLGSPPAPPQTRSAAAPPGQPQQPPNGGPPHSSVITHTNSGQAPAQPVEPVKRGRGRPRKASSSGKTPEHSNSTAMNQQQPSGSTTPIQQHDSTTPQHDVFDMESDSSAADTGTKKDRLRRKKKSKHKDAERSKVRYDIVTSPTSQQGSTKILLKMKLSRSPVKGPEPGKEPEKTGAPQPETREDNLLRPPEDSLMAPPEDSLLAPPEDSLLAPPEGAGGDASNQDKPEISGQPELQKDESKKPPEPNQEETRKVDKIVISPSHGDSSKLESRRVERERTSSRRGSDRSERERTRNDSERSHHRHDRDKERERPEPVLTEQEKREKKEIGKRLASIEATRRELKMKLDAVNALPPEIDLPGSPTSPSAGRSLRTRKRTRSEANEVTEEPAESSPKPPEEPAQIFVNMEADNEGNEKEDTEAPSKRFKADKPAKKPVEEEEEPEFQEVDEELMDSPTFKRFNTAIETVFENSEEMDMSVEPVNDDEEEEQLDPDLLVGKSLLSELVSESAKLKSMGVMNKMPHDRLVRLLNILERNIRDGTKINPNMQNEEDTVKEQRLWREVTLERVTRSVDAALTAVYVMTSENMPKEVFIEDVIDRIAQLTKYQLTNTIYPEFDPVWVTPDEKNLYAGSMKMRRARAQGSKEKVVLSLYNKMCELVSNLSHLLNIQVLTDSTVLLVSSIGTAPFFVENISEMQLSAMKLICTVFSRYEKHRQLVLEDIFASLARLPSSKKNLRNFRLNTGEYIQMVTALVLQLIQCVVVLPADADEVHKDAYDEEELEDENKDKPADKDVIITNAYETAVRTGQNFLSVFLKKCVSKEEEDYRPLFENFIQDLLTSVNKPEWPAAELLLSLLGRLLVGIVGGLELFRSQSQALQGPSKAAATSRRSTGAVFRATIMHQFGNKGNDMSMRVNSLEYLGQIASRLRKDAVSSKINEDTLGQISKSQDPKSTETTPRSGRSKGSKAAAAAAKAAEKAAEEEKSDFQQNLQKAMLDYLAYNSKNDPAIMFARYFYIAQWFRDTAMELDTAMKVPPKEKKKRKKRDHDDSSDESSEESDSSEEDEVVEEVKVDAEVLQSFEKRKGFLLGVIRINRLSNMSFRKSNHILTYDSAALVARYLASRRPFSQSFDIYLTQILRVLNENAVAVRTRAMKCLSSVVAADPSILARPDVQRAVHCRFMDQSTSVREAAIELVGRFVLMQPTLTTQYYDMLLERILDTGISVRKRVIKTLRDICIEQPEFDKVPMICVKIIRRVNDEEGIKKLVNETFQQMWFTPLPVQDSNSLLQRALNIIDVVAASKDTGYDWLEQLLTNLLKSEENAHNKPVQKACVQITDCLVEHVLRLEETTAKSLEEQKSQSHRLVSCLQTLFLFSKVKPELMVAHATTLQPYLSTKCNTQGDYLVIHNVARILELVIPLMDHPSEVFLASMEEDMMRLIIKHGQMILQSCVSCLGAIVNKATRNYRLVRDCFQKYFGVLSRLKIEHEQNKESENFLKNKPTLLRSLFTCGLFCKHFDFDANQKRHHRDSFSHGSPKALVKDRVFEVLYYFCTLEDEDIKLKALSGVGFLCNTHADFLLGTNMKNLYWGILENKDVSIKLLCQVLKNLQMYLQDEDERMRVADAEWAKVAKKEDLKELGDVQSGMSSSVMQLYLKQVMEVMLHTQSVVRMAALQVVIFTLKQGLVHPVQCVPYLITMGSDEESAIKIKADQMLSEIDSRYPGFIQMKAIAGIKMAFHLQKLLHTEEGDSLRGVRVKENGVVSLCNHVYSIIRSGRSQRRALLTCLLNLFDEQVKTDMELLVFVADNLAYFPYMAQDEPLFVMHHIEISVSVTGANLLQSFKEAFNAKQPSRPSSRASRSSRDKTPEPKKIPELDLSDDEDDEEELVERIPADPTFLIDCCVASQACIMLLVLKQHLKDQYGFRDNTIHRYSPTEAAKVYEKQLNRKPGFEFNPARALELIRNGRPTLPLSEETKLEIVQEYLDFKQLMELMDPSEDEDEDMEPGMKALKPGAAAAGTPGADGTPAAAPAATDGQPNAAPVEENGIADGVSPAPAAPAEQTTTKPASSKRIVPAGADSDEDVMEVIGDPSSSEEDDVPASRSSRRSSRSGKSGRGGRQTPRGTKKPQRQQRQQRGRRRKSYAADTSSEEEPSNSDDSDYSEEE
ncbi:nipped-B-like protein A isoform X2 [Amphiura filiformis]|uniref:nipped-B-like protein A isoform X2 n=1 Tax=Amphiura filiformis TaxID=82378 RepID=UPI003B211E1F